MSVYPNFENADKKSENLISSSFQKRNLRYDPNSKEIYNGVYKKLIDITKEERVQSFRNLLRILQRITLITLPILGWILSSFIENSKAILLIWFSIFAFVAFLELITAYIPDLKNREVIHELEKLQLIKIIEEFAIILGLFNRVLIKDVFNEKILFTDGNAPINLSLETTSKILDCLKKGNSTTTEETCIREISLTLDKQKEQALTNLAKDIASNCDKIFEKDGFTIKIYLKVVENINDSSNVELLVPFAKYPPSTQKGSIFGNSWIGVKNSKTIVWDAVDNLKAMETNDNSNKYKFNSKKYKAILAIPIFNGLGVLSITSKNKDVFKNNDNEIIINCLTLLTEKYLSEILGK